jgi:4-phytase/acid phosphatase
MKRLGLLGLAVLLGLFASTAGHAGAPTPAGLRLERVVLFYRHGIRAPLDGEAAESLAKQPWPAWPVPQSVLTDHGFRGMALLGGYDRLWLVRAGLLPAAGCPAPGRVDIWTNKEERTIKSGEALAEGLAPGCALAVGHLAPGQSDPLFDPLQAHAVPYDPATAVASFRKTYGSTARLIAPHRKAVRTLETILGCDTGPAPCDLMALPGGLAVNGDGTGTDLKGPIPVTSGTAEVFILQYVEGLPPDSVGWGRAGRERLTKISRLHAILFDVHTRSPYMAPRSGGPVARRILTALTAQDGPAVTLLVGHDDGIAAVASLLGVHFRIPTYGRDDPPVGGALGFEVLRDPRSEARFIRIIYQAQTLDQLRDLAPLTLRAPPVVQVLRMPSCAFKGKALCPLADFSRLLERRLRSAGALSSGK